MFVFVLSVMHSGTHLIQNEVLRNFSPSSIQRYKNKFDECMNNHKLVQFFTHITDDNMPLIRELADIDCPVIMPMRHPARIMASFKSRDRSMDDFYSQWRNLGKITDFMAPHFIHVDDMMNRERQMLNVAAHLGIRCRTDWPVNYTTGGVYGNHAFDTTGHRVEPWIMDIYEQTRSYYRSAA